jgi:large subunit ribosomal protein L29
MPKNVRNIREIRVLSDKDLIDAIEDTREQLYTLRLHKASGELKDANQIKANRHNLARLMTVLRERQLAHELTSKEENND